MLPHLARINMMMMNKFNTLESQNLDLIDLDKLNELSKYVDQEQDTKMTR